MYYILEITTAGNAQDEVERKVFTNKEEAMKAYNEAVDEKISEVIYDNGMSEREAKQYRDELKENMNMLDSVMDMADTEGEWQVALFKANN